ncbi:MAG: DUF1501 domain-containing protein [Verrucomicrobiota bacterium]
MKRYNLFPCSGRYASKDKLSRREMLAKSAGGLGGLALSSLLGSSVAQAAGGGHGGTFDLKTKAPPFAPKATSIIFLYMGGGPSQVDLFDPKPALTKYDGKPIPMDVDQRDLYGTAKVMASPFSFAKHGECGAEVSELLPHLSTVVDDIAIVRSGVTTRIDHGEALLMMHTGRPIAGFPTIGSWITYGLGTENENLPAYVAMADSKPYRVRMATSSAFLPALCQATPMNWEGGGDPFAFLNPPTERTDAAIRQRQFLNLTQALNRTHYESRRELNELDARIQNFELAARMQVEAMESVDISKESEATKKLYGIGEGVTNDVGMRCLLARRLVESGVRFVHIMRTDWDHHANLSKQLPQSCLEVDKPVVGLLRDLKSRGLLDSTLVVWTGEFGRMPVVEAIDGRDHNPHGFSFWMAGGGIKPGITYGETDEFGYRAVTDPVSVHDLHATMQHLMGLDPDENLFSFEGRDETLTGVEKARVVEPLLA